MIKRRPLIPFAALALILILGLTGCSRTAEDVAKWKAKGNVSELIKALADPKLEVRQAAAAALGELKAEPGVDALAALYNDPEQAVVDTAVQALAAIGSPSVTTPMIAALKLDNTETRITAARTLGALKAAGAVEPLAEVLDDSEESVRLAAAEALGQIGEEAASAALVKKLTDGSDELRTVCATALGRTGGAVAAEGLIGALADSNGEVREAAKASLITLGKPIEPFALKALRSEKEPIRKTSIEILRALKAIPLTGPDAVWYTLAKVSVDGSAAIDDAVVDQLSRRMEQADTLIAACAHPVPDFREHAFRALENMGEPVTARAMDAVETLAGMTGRRWFAGRIKWAGGTSWRNDLWGALTALNPDFRLDPAVVSSFEMQGRPAFNTLVSPNFRPTREYIPLLISLLGDRTQPPPEQPDYDAQGMPIVKRKRDLFRGEANQQTALDQLEAAGATAVLPLITALDAPDELVAGHAAELLGKRAEARALEPLKRILAAKLENGERLSHSPFYDALQKLDAPSAEPLLLRVRPNSERAMRVFNRKFTAYRAISAETKDVEDSSEEPITFMLGYIDRGRVAKMPVTFVKGPDGNWHPDPPLGNQPSSITM